MLIYLLKSKMYSKKIIYIILYIFSQLKNSLNKSILNLSDN